MLYLIRRLTTSSDKNLNDVVVCVVLVFSVVDVQVSCFIQLYFHLFQFYSSSIGVASMYWR